jgi:hypothetical protein
VCGFKPCNVGYRTHTRFTYTRSEICSQSPLLVTAAVALSVTTAAIIDAAFACLLPTEDPRLNVSWINHRLPSMGRVRRGEASRTEVRMFEMSRSSTLIAGAAASGITAAVIGTAVIDRIFRTEHPRSHRQWINHQATDYSQFACGAMRSFARRELTAPSQWISIRLQFPGCSSTLSTCGPQEHRNE